MSNIPDDIFTESDVSPATSRYEARPPLFDSDTNTLRRIAQPEPNPLFAAVSQK